MKALGDLISDTRIITLSVNYCKLGDIGGVSMGEAILRSKKIEELRAMHNEFKDATAKAFAESIEKSDNCVI